MDVIWAILRGCAYIFRGYSPVRDPDLEALKAKYLDPYKTMTDRERLAQDWRAVSRDMRKAFNKIKAERKER